MDKIIVKITDIAKSTITRQRGNEAFEKLKQILECEKPEEIVIDMTDAKLVTLSFIDAIVLNLKKNPDLLNTKFHFVIQSRETLNNLGKVSLLRNFDCYYRFPEENSSKPVDKIPMHSETPSKEIENEEFCAESLSIFQ